MGSQYYAHHKAQKSWVERLSTMDVVSELALEGKKRLKNVNSD